MRTIPRPEPNGQDTWRIFRIMAEFVEGFEVMAPVKRGSGVPASLAGAARRPRREAPASAGL